jgi:ribosomal protein S27E
MGHMCSARVQRPCAKSAGGEVKRRYVRHRPEETVLYDVVERHQGAFFAHLEHGFVWVKCEGCRHEHLVAFSCKGRGFCPSCASRRMAETGAKLVDDILPVVPYRQ